MRTSHTSSSDDRQEPSVEDHFFATLPLSRILVEMGVLKRIMTDLGLGHRRIMGLLDFDATTLLIASRAGRVKLPPRIAHEAKRILKEGGYRPDLMIQQELEERALEFLSQFGLCMPDDGNTQ